MKYTYKTQGTCSSHIELEIENNIITNIAFWGGCNGNLQGLSRLVKGMSVNDVISRLEGFVAEGVQLLVRISYVGHCMKWDSN